MGKINQSKNTEDPYKVGTVLFTAGDSKNDDAWDDSELIRHWEENVEAYRKMYLNEAKDTFQRKTKITKKKPVTRKTKETYHTQQSTSQTSLPPMPPLPTSQEELSNLIMAWYYCGYYTGIYQAQRQ